MDKVKGLLERKSQCQSLKNIVVMSPASNELTTELRQTALENAGITLSSFEEFEALGDSNNIADNPPTPDDLATICYTSGTTVRILFIGNLDYLILGSILLLVYASH